MDLLHILTVVMFMMLIMRSVMCVEIPIRYSKEQQRKKRSTVEERFILGPDGTKCILYDEFDLDKMYSHVDENGQCCCGLCNLGTYIRRFCMCSPDSQDPLVVTDCAFVTQGIQFMDKPNNCTMPYTCATRCKDHQRRVSDCTSNADLNCVCEDGWFNPNRSDVGSIPRECRQIPHCKAGEEPKEVSNDGDEVVYTCQPCKDGFYKQESNSAKSCRPRRVCQTEAGSSVSDNKCLNDDVSRMTRQPSSEIPPSSTQLRDSTSPAGGQRETVTAKPGVDTTGVPVWTANYQTGFFSLLFVVFILVLALICACFEIKTRKLKEIERKKVYTAVPMTSVQ